MAFRVLVTGASGFLGAHLARQLVDAGYQVRASYRPSDDTRLIDSLPIEAAPCDLLGEAGLRRVVAGVEAVFHAAALVTFRPELYALQQRVNVEGTRSMLAAAREVRVRRFLHTSTVNALGIPRQGTVGDETTPWDWGRHAIGYMDSKHAAQQLVLAAAADGLDALCLLPCTMFGPGDLLFNAGTYIRLAARGLLLAAPSGGTNVVHVEDVARGHLLALEHGAAGELYVLGGDNLTYRELFTLIAEELGVRGPLVTLPGGPLRAAGRIADGLRAATGLPLPLSEGVMVAGSALLHYSSDKARRVLGYTARPAREAIRDAVRWYRENDLL